MTKPRASIVVPAYNAASTLAQCLEACLAQTVQELEILVVDDGSTDSTAEIARRHPIQYIHQANAGPAAARNAGARAAKAPVVVFTDSDCVPEPDWIERLLDAFSPGVVAVGGSYGIANPERWLARAIHEEIAARHRQMVGEVDFLGSFNVAYDREAFWDVGGFDETFRRASGEDNDIAYRLHDRHGALWFAPSARVAHHHPDRLIPYLRTQSNHGFWRMKLYAKHPGRMGGDRYASRLDLWAPILALLAVLFTTFTLFLAPTGFRAIPVSITALWVWCLWIAVHIPKTRALLRASAERRMVLFLPVAMLRDLARAWGLVRGFWHFMFLKRQTA